MDTRSLSGRLADFSTAHRDAEGRLWLTYEPSTDLPELDSVPLGGLLLVLDVPLDPLLYKQVGDPSGQISDVDVPGIDHRGLWVSGEPHDVFVVSDVGGVERHAGRVSGNALIWENAGTTYRFETAADLSTVIDFIGG